MCDRPVSTRLRITCAHLVSGWALTVESLEMTFANLCTCVTSFLTEVSGWAMAMQLPFILNFMPTTHRSLVSLFDCRIALMLSLTANGDGL